MSNGQLTGQEAGGGFIRLPDGRVVDLSGYSEEERREALEKLWDRYGSEYDVTPAPTTPAAPEQPPVTPPTPSVPPTTPAVSPYEGMEHLGEKTRRGAALAGLKAIPVGFQQAVLMAKQGVLGTFSPGVETEGERKVQRDLENLILKIDPRYQDAHLVQLGMGLGTMGGLMAPALIPGIGGPLAFGAAGMMGLGEQTSRIARHERETGEDVSTSKELLAMGMGLGIGFTEMVTPARLFKRLEPFKRSAIQATKGRGLAKTVEEIGEEIAKEDRLSTFRKLTAGGKDVLTSAMKQAAEEAAQESAAGFSQSVTARFLYDDDALVGAGADAIKEAILGGEVGAIADLSFSMGMRAMGLKGRNRVEQMRLAGELIQDEHQLGLSLGTIDEGVRKLTETQPVLDKEGQETGEWEFVDQSEGAQSMRGNAKIDENLGVSPLMLQAAAFTQEVIQRIEQEYNAGNMDESKKDSLIKEAQEQGLFYNRVTMLLQKRLIGLETGVDPLHVTPEGDIIPPFERAVEEKDTGPQEKVINLARARAQADPLTFADNLESDVIDVEQLDGLRAAEAYVEEINRLRGIFEEDERNREMVAGLNAGVAETTAAWTSEEAVDAIPEPTLPPTGLPAPTVSRTEYGPDGTTPVRQIDVDFDTRVLEDGYHVPDGVKVGDTIEIFNIKGEKVPVEIIAISEETGAIRFKTPDGTESILYGEFVLDDINNPEYVLKTSGLGGLQGRRISEFKDKSQVLAKLEELWERVKESAQGQGMWYELIQDMNAVKQAMKPPSTLDEGRVEAQVERILAGINETGTVTDEDVDGLEGPSTVTLEDTPTVNLGYLYNRIFTQLVPDAQAQEQQIEAEVRERLKLPSVLVARLQAEKRHLNELKRWMDGDVKWKDLDRNVKDWLNERLAVPYTRQKLIADDIADLRATPKNLEAGNLGELDQLEQQLEVISNQIGVEEGRLAKRLSKTKRATGEARLEGFREDYVQLTNDLASKEAEYLDLIARRTAATEKYGSFNNREATKKRYIENMLGTVDSRIADIEEGNPTEDEDGNLVEDSFIVPDGFGDEIAEERREIVKGINAISSPEYLARMLNIEKDKWYPVGFDVKTGAAIYGEGRATLNDLEGRLPLESQRMALRNLQEAFNAAEDPSLVELSPAEVSDYIREIFAGSKAAPSGLYKGYERAFDILVRETEEQRWTAVDRVRLPLVRREEAPVERTKEEKKLLDRAEKTDEKMRVARKAWRDVKRKKKEKEKTFRNRKVKKYEAYEKARDENQEAEDALEEAGLLRWRPSALERAATKTDRELAAKLNIAQNNLNAFASSEEAQRRFGEIAEAFAKGEEPTVDRRTKVGKAQALVDEKHDQLKEARADAFRELEEYRRLQRLEGEAEPREVSSVSEAAAEIASMEPRTLLQVHSIPTLVYPQFLSEPRGGAGVERAFRLVEGAGDQFADDIVDPPNFNQDEVNRLRGALTKPQTGKTRQNKLEGEFLEGLGTPGIVLQKKEDGRYHVVGGINLFVAAKKGGLGDKATGRTTIDAREIPARTEALTEPANNVMKSVWDLTGLQSLGFFLENNATDHSATEDEIPFTAPENLKSIKKQFINSGGKITRGMLEDALVAKGIAEIRRGKLVVGKVDRSVDGKIIQVDFLEALISDTFGKEATVESLLDNEKILLLDRILTGPVQTRQTSKQKPISERSPIIVKQRRTILERISAASREAPFSMASNSNSMKQLIDDLILGTVDELSRLDVAKLKAERGPPVQGSVPMTITARPDGGVTVAGLHGTRTSGQLAKKFGGIHIGTRRAAIQRLAQHVAGRVGGTLGAEKLQSIEAELSNPLGSVENPIDESALFELLNLPESLAELKAQGVDGIIYRNAEEDRGQISVVVFDAQSVRIVQEANASDEVGRFEQGQSELWAEVRRLEKVVEAEKTWDPSQVITKIQRKEVGDAIRNFVISLGDSVVHAPTNRNRVWLRSLEDPELKAEPVSNEEAEVKAVGRAVDEVVEEGTKEEARGEKQWKNTKGEKKAEIVRAGKRIDAYMKVIRARAMTMFGPKALAKLQIELTAFEDSLYAGYVKRVVNRNLVKEPPALFDTHLGKLVFNISMLEEQMLNGYKDVKDIPIDEIVKNAMMHEGVHVLFFKGALSKFQIENLKRYGIYTKVPKEVSESAFAQDLTWRKWVESKPQYMNLDEASLTEETSIQILDALAMGTIPGSKSGGGIGQIKREILDRIKMVLGISREADLHSIMSVFNVVQDHVELARKVEAVEESDLGALRYAERADPDDLRELVDAQKEGDTEKAKEIAKRIAHSRVDLPEITPDKQFFNEMRARQEIQDTPKGITSTINGGAVLDGVITARSLDEFFNIQDGKPPYRMTGSRIRALGRTRSKARSEGDERIRKLVEEANKIEGRTADDEKGGPVSWIRKAVDALMLRSAEDGKVIDEVDTASIKKAWKYSWKMKNRMKMLDRTLPMGLSSLRAEARRKALGIAGQVNSITAWKYAHNSQNFVHGLWFNGPIEYVDPKSKLFRGFKIRTGQTVEIDGEIRDVKALGDIFEAVLLAGDEMIEGTHYFGESLRVVETHQRLQGVRELFEREFGIGLDERFGGIKVDPKTGQRRLGKKKKELGLLDKASYTDTLQGWDLYNRPPEGVSPKRWRAMLWEIGEWQRRYDRLNPPGKNPRTGERQAEKLDRLTNNRQQVLREASEVGSEAYIIKTFWDEFRVFNYKMIDFAFDAEIINAKRRDLYQSISFMPFYRDVGGWEENSLFENINSPEYEEGLRRQEAARGQNVAPAPGFDKKGHDLIDKNIEGSFLPLDQDLVGNILRNVQALTRDAMWNQAVNGTVDEMVGATDIRTGQLVPEAAEQVFIHSVVDLTPKEIKIAQLTDKQRREGNTARLTETQKANVLHSRGLFTQQELSDQGYEDLAIRLKKDGEYRYYRTLDHHMAQMIMAVGVGPRQILEDFFMEHSPITMNEEWAKRSAKLLVGSSDLLRKAVTASPVFWNVNVMRDSWQASVVFGHGPKVVMKAFNNFFNPLEWGIFGQDIDPETGRARREGARSRGQRLGIAVGVDFRMAKEEATENAVKMAKAQNMKWDTPQDWVLNFIYFGPAKFIRAGMAQSEVATRLAVYDLTMEDTNGDAQLAYNQAMEIINFGRRGSSPIFSAVMGMSPFFNGRLQGLDVTWRSHIGSVDVPGLYRDDNLVDPYEALAPSKLIAGEGPIPLLDPETGEPVLDPETGKPVGQELRVAMPTDYRDLTRGSKRFARARKVHLRGLGTMMLTLLYYAWMWDEDEYKNAREDEKNNFWIMPWGTRIPIPFEIGVIYKMIPEQILRWLNTQEPEHGPRQVREAMTRTVKNSLGLDWRPQFYRNAWDAHRNIDRFQRDQIVPTWMDEDLLSSLEMRDNTSLVSRGLSGVFDKVPFLNHLKALTSSMRLEYLLRQQFGTLFAYGVSVADAIAAWSLGINRAGTPYNWGITSLVSPKGGQGREDGVHPLGLPGWNRIPILGDLIFDPREGGGYQEDLYRLNEMLNFVVTSLGALEKVGDTEGAKRWEEKHKVIFKYQDRIRHLEGELGHLRDDLKNIKDEGVQKFEAASKRRDKTQTILRNIEDRDEIIKEVHQIMGEMNEQMGLLEAVFGRERGGP